ncbi:MAG: CinA family protein, partial [Actinobacteria bacterium]|nr:CinA family protein [Actinomycetota bacterium]MCG2802440.1 CinA family protein [Cellulomonas sp.]
SVLGVDPTLLAHRGAVDPDVALAMARGVRQLLEAQVGVATTGVAGPEPQDGAAVGTVFVAVVTPTRAEVRRLRLGGDRAQIRAAAVEAALALVRELVDDPS